tara:strand:+ start:118 stop:1683 length:1566 start_codon:yes stop_codon:yes gene_type:complete
MRLIRFLKIISLAIKFGIDEILLFKKKNPLFLYFFSKLIFWRNLDRPRSDRLKCFLEELGPIFVKFGQLLSTRRDLVPEDIADSLSLLQDSVAPFSSDLAISQIKLSLGKYPDELFMNFIRKPVASASVAQVHFATLKNGTEVAVKILRPNVRKIISKDIDLMYIFANLIENWWKDGKRLKPVEVVKEFEKYLYDELDLIREAANASQLKRNFDSSKLLLVPEMFWDYCSESVIVMKRMKGIPVSQIDRIIEAGIDLKKLSRDGVEIFFTQVFRDGFFHADMHPGNIMVSNDPETYGRYIAIDFGIMGTLSDFDKDYLSQNFLAFFRRDYKRVAQAHIESGWVPKDTRVDDLESAVRTCCEPIFNRPLSEISFGQLLLRLFQTSRRFNVEVQPQLVLLQKTLLNVEGLGRELDPDLDLWQTAKPHLEKWMREQIGFSGLIEKFKSDLPLYRKMIPVIPKIIQKSLESEKSDKITIFEKKYENFINGIKKINVYLILILLFLILLNTIVLLKEFNFFKLWIS